MKLKKLLEGTGAKIDLRLSEINITSVSTDSKNVKKNSLFIAIEGLEFDGHKFVDKAFKNGSRVFIVDKRKKMHFPKGNLIKVDDTRKALSVVAKNFYHSPSEKLKVIGITGTNGKTTTSLLVESIFKRAHIPCSIIGTIEYRIGRACIPAERTTPDAISINTLLEKAVKSGEKAAVMEVSSHGLDQKRVDDIFFDAAIFTNLTREHLDYHGSLERYFASKAKIFTTLKKDGVAIINANDKTANRIKKIVNHRKITYALDKTADVTAKIKKVGPGGSSFVTRLHGKDAFGVNTKLVGLHNISNILAAIAAGVAQDIDLRAIKEGIEKVNSVRGRLEPVQAGQGFKIFVDYAHTHNALENVLRFLNQIKNKNIITVFGCGGDRDRGKRPLMGRVAQGLSDFVIITDDNPRGEDPRKIARDIEKGMDGKNKNYTILLNRKKAIEKALRKARVGDIVLIAGKGHEKVQIIGDREIPFDDKRVAREALRKSR
ncbi:MAG: UDP-N-acetylmuramoyl-L-alanyl-D-glutamate--2,6-diaminopimelate ligase [Candidatus Omnitrophota bacterium]|nr:MAG: UDP-N-acetylmuramoyl-L-alanyl-D-glutamate--2,6-diaminopimelate ligase [Candidatus Omnitrophota bacterium]